MVKVYYLYCCSGYCFIIVVFMFKVRGSVLVVNLYGMIDEVFEVGVLLE